MPTTIACDNLIRLDKQVLTGWVTRPLTAATLLPMVNCILPWNVPQRQTDLENGHKSPGAMGILLLIRSSGQLHQPKCRLVLLSYV